PKMVERWELNGSPQPIIATNVRTYGFLLDATPTRPLETCLNRPSNNAVSYELLYPSVMLTFSQIARISAADPPYSTVGWATETEAVMWVFCRRVRPPSLAPRWFCPYIFLDVPAAITEGREVYGFPKEIGRFRKPAPNQWHTEPPDGPHANSFTLDVFGAARFASKH